MSREPQGYERAVSGSLLGLALQAACVGVLLGLSLWTGEPAVQAAAWLAAAGLPVWIALALVHQQHRLERIEALEAEQLAQRSGAEQGIFERNAADLSAARRRLNQLYAWGLPLTGVLVGACLLGMGVWQILLRAPLLAARAEPAAPGYDPLLAMAFCAGLALAGFLTGRFIAGMARVAEWQLLRGGAGYLLGVVVCALGLTAGLGAARYEMPGLLHWLAVLIPALMALAGAEVLLNVVLDLYRPRKAGERARPAFDARLLGLLTVPEGLAKAFADALNYQFGFEVTHSWFWKLLGRAFAPLLAFAVGVLLLLSCLVFVEPQQQALVITFGRLGSEPVGPGLHLKLPWPLATAELYDVARIHEIKVGTSMESKPGEAVLWDNQHAVTDEGLMIVAAPSAAVRDGGKPGGRAPAISLLVADARIQYRIKDLPRYAQAGSRASVEAWLKCAAERALTLQLYGLTEGEMLGPARLRAGEELRTRLQQMADTAGGTGLGIEVLFAGLVEVHPHAKAAGAFHESVRAMQEKETRIEEARRDRIRILCEAAGSPEYADLLIAEVEKLDALKRENAPAAAVTAQELALEKRMREGAGQAAEELARAEADRWSRENVERGNAERFLKEVLAQQHAPRYFAARRYLEVLAEGLAEARKYVLVAERERLTIRMDFKDQDLNLPLDVPPAK